MKDIILCNDEGLAVRIGGGPAMSLPWSDVRCVHAHRVDRMTSTLLIVGVEDETGHVVELNPTMEGWADFLDRIAQRAHVPTAELLARLERLAVPDSPLVLFQHP